MPRTTRNQPEEDPTSESEAKSDTEASGGEEEDEVDTEVDVDTDVDEAGLSTRDSNQSYRKVFIRILEGYKLNKEAATALYDGGFVNYDSMAEFTPTEVTEVCRTLRKQNMIVSFTAEKELKLLCYGLALERTCNREWIPPIEVEHDLWKARQQLLKDYTTPTVNFDVETYKGNWPKIMEGLEDLIREFRGVSTKAPLTYVIRKDPVCPADIGGLTEYLDSEFGGDYDKMLVARCLHFKDNYSSSGGYMPTYIQDNAVVFRILLKVFRTQPAYTFIHPFAKVEDGRAAWFALINHYLGPNNANNLATRFETELRALAYHGERRRWTFEKYSNKLVELVNSLNDLKAYGYAGIDNASAVRYLMNGIKTKDLEVMQGQINAKASKIELSDAITEVKDYLVQFTQRQGRTTTPTDSRQVAALSGTPSNKRKRSSDDDKIDDRYYTPAEYSKLSSAQKNALRLKRRKSPAPRSKPKGRSRENNAQVGAVQLDTLSETLAKAIISAVRPDGGTCDEMVENDDVNSQSNRLHPALTKQRKS
jgi:hypothetical protein